MQKANSSYAMTIRIRISSGQQEVQDRVSCVPWVWALLRSDNSVFPAIVTRFHLQLLSLPSCIRSSSYIYPAELYHPAFEWVQSMVPTADYDTEVVMIAFHGSLAKVVCFKVHFVTMKDSILEAEKALQELHHGRPDGFLAESFCQEDTLESLYKGQSAANPPSHYYHTDNVFIKSGANVTKVLENAFQSLPDGKSFAFWYPMQPWSKQARSDMALSMYSDDYFSIYMISQDQDEALRYETWLERTMAEMAKFSVGSYLGDSDLKLQHDWHWRKSSIARLQTVRQAWDPTSLFCTVRSDGK